jgi:type II secretory pathway pseudopilin PulG
MVRSNETQKGFTLVELLLYVSLVGLMSFVIAAFVPLLLDTREKNTTIAEVEQQGALVLGRIAQEVRNAEAITSPSAGSNGSSLTLDVVAGADDPTVFDLSSGALRITQGAGSATDLTNSRVTVSDLDFENLSAAGTPGTVQFSFTITHNNSSGRNAYDFSQSFVGSSSLRQ